MPNRSKIKSILTNLQIACLSTIQQFINIIHALILKYFFNAIKFILNILVM